MRACFSRPVLMIPLLGLVASWATIHDRGATTAAALPTTAVADATTMSAATVAWASKRAVAVYCLGAGCPVNRDVVLARLTVPMVGGTGRYLRSVLVTSTTATISRPLVAHAIVCRHPSQVLPVGQIWTTTNRYAIDGAAATTARMLVRAPFTGTFTCDLIGHFASHSVRSVVVTVHATSYVQVLGAVVARPVTSIARGRGTLVRTSTSVAVIDGYVPPTTARTIDVIGDAELTDCYSTCDPGTSGSWTRVRSVLVVVQRSTTGAACHVTFLPGVAITSQIDRARHHVKVFHRGTVAIRSGCARRFSVRIAVLHLAGDAVYVEGGAYTRSFVRPLA